MRRWMVREETREERLERVLRQLVTDLDRWEDAVETIVGRRVHPWGTLDEARELVGKTR